MRRSLATISRVCALPILAVLAGCANLPPDQQAKVQQMLTVACLVDGVVVPVAQPVVATLGSAGAAAAGVDSLLVHPAVVTACSQLGGAPASATPVSPAGVSKAQSVPMSPPPP
jgi:hypothetical protein